jgi:hypothetical protein
MEKAIAKALGRQRGPLVDVTWHRLPSLMLRLLLEIAEAEKRPDAPPSPFDVCFSSSSAAQPLN